jgi:hypothetical protein
VFYQLEVGIYAAELSGRPNSSASATPRHSSYEACVLWMKAIMLEILVYYHDVLRYTIYATSDKVQELRNQGFYVEVRAIPLQDKSSAQLVPSGQH